MTVPTPTPPSAIPAPAVSMPQPPGQAPAPHVPAPSTTPQPGIGPVGTVQTGGLPPVPTYAPQLPGQPAQPQPQAPQLNSPEYMMQQMQQQNQMMADMNRTLIAQLNSTTAQPATPEAPAPEYTPFAFNPEVKFTDQDREAMGKLDGAVTRKIQQEALTFLQPVLEHINSLGQQVFEANNKFTGYEQQLAGTQDQIYSTALMTSIPNLNAIIQDPQFQQFAGQTVPYTNKTVRQMMADAHHNKDISGLRSIVEQFNQSRGAQPGQQPGQQLPVQTQTTANPGMFGQGPIPVQAPPMANYMQPQTTPGTPQTPAPSGNQALIQQQYEQAKARYNAEKTPEARQLWEAASAKMFEMQMGLVQ